MYVLETEEEEEQEGKWNNEICCKENKFNKRIKMSLFFLIKFYLFLRQE